MNWRFWRRPLSPAKIAKIAALAANPFAQPEVRMQKMERLLEEGSEAALEGVLRRLGANAQGQIADEEEKSWLVEALVDAGDVAIAPLEGYIRRGHKLTHALAAYARLRGDAPAADFFAACLTTLGPDDHRTSEAKLQLIDAWAARAPAARLGEVLAPFLGDHSDDVRWAVLEVFDRAAAEAAGGDVPVWDQAVRPHLVGLCTRGEASARIAGRAARLLAVHGWPWLPPRASLAAPVARLYQVDAAGRLAAL